MATESRPVTADAPVDAPGPPEALRPRPVPPSPAGPAEDGAAIHLPPRIRGNRASHLLRFSLRQHDLVTRARREHGDVFRVHAPIPGEPSITAHPEHVRSLFTAKPELAPSVTAESPLRPIVGPNSVLTANGPRHLRQRRLLLPPFHGEAIARYATMIEEVAEREIATWPQGRPFALAPRMQTITLDVIMAGIFGFTGPVVEGSPEHRLRHVIQRLTAISTTPVAKLGELVNVSRDEPVGLVRRGVGWLDSVTYPIIEERRRAPDLDERTDILSLLMRATTEDGELLTDRELRDELLTLVLAGFETTANSLSWAWERLVRWPDAHERLITAVREDAPDADDVVERTILEAMRSRPVIPIIGRRVTVPWRLGEYVVPAGSPISISILLVHHRDDLYPDPYAFRPDRWIGRKPGTYEWIPFGGGTRRCLGSALAMAEQRVVLTHMARRLDLRADRPEPEAPQHRNVTMIPARGARVVITGRR
ncbi:MAG: cytochrome P450 [Solirubrobacteraceae bacterium]|nr:cytochrome P450 [Solirubrobacteraceae bacterium]